MSLASLGFHKLVDKEEDSTAWDTYGDESSLRVYCENQQVISIAVYDQLLFQGENLIGLSLENLSRLLKCGGRYDETVDFDDGPQEIWEFSDYGLQVWTQEGNIIAAICDDGL